jgi:starch synthase
MPDDKRPNQPNTPKPRKRPSPTKPPKGATEPLAAPPPVDQPIEPAAKPRTPANPRAASKPRAPKAATERKPRTRAKLPTATGTGPAPDRRRSKRSDAIAGLPAAAAPTPSPVAQPIVETAKNAALSILMVAPEAHPFAKTGGLAEVTAALSDALVRLGHAVTLVLPRYRGIDVAGASRFQTRLRLGDRLQPVAIHERYLSERLRLVLVDVPDLFDREALYGTADGDYADNAWRFAVFSRAALEYARAKEWRPSVIHAHDWQTGLVPVYQKMHLSDDPFVGGVPVVFTLHNLAFQGVFSSPTVAAIGLPPEVQHVQGMEYWGNVSYLKGGINFSEKITTVSPGYAREIVEPELGFGLEGVLARRSDDLVGILNGIDTARWTPEGDPFVPASFNAGNLGGKRQAKRALLDVVKLPSDERSMARPLIAMISRLTEQKGFDLIAAASDDLMALDASWVMLGSGERRFENHWRTLAMRHPDRVAATIGFDERLAHLIEAGADMFLMPSRFEPCGLNQMYSLRYGTVPIVRATGGLKDTVEDADASVADQGTGFTFRDYTPAALVETVTRALDAFGHPDRWQAVQKRGMQRDHSWDASAREYVKLYVDVSGRPTAPGPQTP